MADTGLGEEADKEGDEPELESPGFDALHAGTRFLGQDYTMPPPDSPFFRHEGGAAEDEVFGGTGGKGRKALPRKSELDRYLDIVPDPVEGLFGGLVDPHKVPEFQAPHGSGGREESLQSSGLQPIADIPKHDPEEAKQWDSYVRLQEAIHAGRQMLGQTYTMPKMGQSDTVTGGFAFHHTHRMDKKPLLEDDERYSAWRGEQQAEKNPRRPHPYLLRRIRAKTRIINYCTVI